MHIHQVPGPSYNILVYTLARPIYMGGNSSGIIYKIKIKYAEQIKGQIFLNRQIKLYYIGKSKQVKLKLRDIIFCIPNNIFVELKISSSISGVNFQYSQQ